MEKLEVTFRTVTPLFIMGGAKQDIREELRPPSIKGVLRFWYRAIYPNNYCAHESGLFGGTGRKEGQAKILLRITPSHLIHGAKNELKWAETKIPYLGYGVFDRLPTGEFYPDKNGRKREEKKSMTTRPYIAENSTFTLTVLFKPPRIKKEVETYEADKTRVKRAIWAMTMFGGLGARSRKGFGALAVVAQTGLDGLPTLMPKNNQELCDAIKCFTQNIEYQISSLPADPAEHTCFSSDSRCLVSGNAATAEQAFSWLAGAVHDCRSYRFRGHYQITENDHDLMYKFFTHGTQPSSPPKRAAFGLPHNYFFSGSGKKGSVDYMEGGKRGRRASPLFFKVCDFNGAGACVVATFLPARLIPEGESVTLTGDCTDNGCRYTVTRSLPDDFTAVTALLDKLGGQEVLP